MCVIQHIKYLHLFDQVLITSYANAANAMFVFV